MNRSLILTATVILLVLPFLAAPCRAQSQPFRFNPGNNLQDWSLDFYESATDLPGLVRILVLEVVIGSANQVASGSIEATNWGSIDILTVKVTHNPGASPRPAFSLGISNMAGNPSADLDTVYKVYRTSSSNADLILGINGAHRIGGEDPGDLGYLFADKFGNILVTGDIEAEITTDNGGLGGNGFVVNQLGAVQCGGMFRGSVEVPQNATGGNGQIFSIVAGGAIGASGDPASIWGGTVVHEVEGSEIWADILAGESVSNHNGNIRIINTTGAGTASGDLNGTVRAYRLTQQLSSDQVHVDGDLEADITLLQNILIPVIVDGDFNGDLVVETEIKDNTGTGETDGRISIGGDLNGNITVGTRLLDTDSSDADGLTGIAIGGVANGTIAIGDELDGQIAVRNSGNSGAPTGLVGQIIVNGNAGTADWLDNVVLGTSGTITIGPGGSQPDLAPYYERLSTDIGGGAVGLVPFMFHAAESDPAHGSIITTGGFSGDVTIEHYGPVADADGSTTSTPPVKVYELALQVPCCDPVPNPATTAICDEDEESNPYWTDVTGNFTYAVSGRVVTVTGTFSTWKAYQFIPSDLVCDIAGGPSVVYAQGWEGTTGCTGMAATHGYGFQIKSGMGLLDLNQNNAIESGDISTWLANPTDFDTDGDADTADLGVLADAVGRGE